jgi:hypothetical protein
VHAPPTPASQPALAAVPLSARPAPSPPDHLLASPSRPPPLASRPPGRPLHSATDQIGSYPIIPRPRIRRVTNWYLEPLCDQIPWRTFVMSPITGLRGLNIFCGTHHVFVLNPSKPGGGTEICAAPEATSTTNPSPQIRSYQSRPSHSRHNNHRRPTREPRKVNNNR